MSEFDGFNDPDLSYCENDLEFKKHFLHEIANVLMESEVSLLLSSGMTAVDDKRREVYEAEVQSGERIRTINGPTLVMTQVRLRRFLNQFNRPDGNLSTTLEQ